MYFGSNLGCVKKNCLFPGLSRLVNFKKALTDHCGAVPSDPVQEGLQPSLHKYPPSCLLPAYFVDFSSGLFLPLYPPPSCPPSSLLLASFNAVFLSYSLLIAFTLPLYCLLASISPQPPPPPFPFLASFSSSFFCSFPCLFLCLLLASLRSSCLPTSLYF